MVTDILRLEDLNLEELSGVVNIYPWFSAARKELCSRMAALGDGAWSMKRFAQEALYVNDRGKIYLLARKSEETDLSDAQLESLLSSYFEKSGKSEALNKVIVVGGDYFSTADYEKVRRDDDNVLASFCPEDKEGDVASPLQLEEEFTDFCTESLAQVYLEQGYPDQAKNIYSKLILRYPEKSVYFATLIEKIDNKI